jgi:hypothetical protein
MTDVGVEEASELAAVRQRNPGRNVTDERGLPGRPLTIRVVARDDHGGRYRRAMIVELTGRADQPYWVRSLE